MEPQIKAYTYDELREIKDELHDDAIYAVFFTEGHKEKNLPGFSNGREIKEYLAWRKKLNAQLEMNILWGNSTTKIGNIE